MCVQGSTVRDGSTISALQSGVSVVRHIADLTNRAQVSTANFDSNGHALQNGYAERQTWSASSASQPDSNPFSPDSYSDMAFPRPQRGDTPQDHTTQNMHLQPTSAATPRQLQPYAASEHSANSITSPNSYIFPSLPAESPSGKLCARRDSTE